MRYFVFAVLMACGPNMTGQQSSGSDADSAFTRGVPSGDKP